MPGVPDWIAVWSSLGVIPVTIPLGGIYNALRDGVADASEGDLTQILSLHLYEVQSHLSLTNHLVGFGMVTGERLFHERASARVSKTRSFTRCSRPPTGEQNRMNAQEATLLSTLQGLGMITVIPNAAAIRLAAEPAINNLFATKWTDTTWAEPVA